MQFKLLVLLALCALATGLPRDKRSLEAESESGESEEQNEIDITSTLPGSKIIAVSNSTDLETRITEAGDKVVIIYLMVGWCPFCKKINPSVEDIAAKTENLVVLKVNRDNLKEDQSVWKYGLSDLPSVPMFIFVKNGKKVEELIGSDSDLQGTLSKLTSLVKNRSKSSKNSSNSSNNSSKSSKESSESSDSSAE